MAFLQLVAGLTLFWCLLRLVLDRYTHAPKPDPRRPTSTFLPLADRPATSPAKSSFTHSLGHIQYETTHLNPLFRSVALRLAPLWRPWFAFGMIVGLGCMVAACGILGVGACRAVVELVGAWYGWGVGHASPDPETSVDFRANSSLIISTGGSLGRGVGGNGLVSLIPGVNLPLSQLPYYFAALFVSGVIHEFGHALAAVIYRVPVQSSGIFLAVLYPGAFVHLHEPSLSLLSPIHKLHIICAGVHHNLMLGLMALGTMYALPWILSPGYSSLEQSVVVLDIMQESPLVGHLSRGSQVQSINHHQIVNGIGGWEDALWYETGNVALKGWCVPRNVGKEPPLECCNVSKSQPLGPPGISTQCFRRSNVPFANASLPISSDADTFSCLPLHDILATHPSCSSSQDCMQENGQDRVPVDCVVPHIAHPDIRILRLELVGDDDDDHAGHNPMITFLGDPREVWEGVQVGSLLPRFILLPLALPYMLERFLQFTISLTFALAVFNMVPAFHLDGHHALLAITDWVATHANPGMDARRDRATSALVAWIDRASRVALVIVMIRGVIGAIK
ncbi:peptidase family M50-domain-containing protein [Powellomyces hirtus]|nr:peptidase family M50-domain-containing protein [Powellomyces hirtus]